MRDLPVALSGTWIKGVFLAVVFYDRSLQAVGLDPGGQMYFVDGGERYVVTNASTFAGDRIACLLNPAFTATSMADGAYYIRPPSLFATPEGWPVPDLRAFPVTVLP